MSVLIGEASRIAPSLDEFARAATVVALLPLCGFLARSLVGYTCHAEHEKSKPPRQSRSWSHQKSRESKGCEAKRIANVHVDC